MGKNWFPRHFVDNCIKAFLDKMFETKRIVTAVSKRELRICLSFLGTESLKIKSNLSKLAKSYFPECKLFSVPIPDLEIVLVSKTKYP